MTASTKILTSPEEPAIPAEAIEAPGVPYRRLDEPRRELRGRDGRLPDPATGWTGRRGLWVRFWRSR